MLTQLLRRKFRTAKRLLERGGWSLVFDVALKRKESTADKKTEQLIETLRETLQKCETSPDVYEDIVKGILFPMFPHIVPTSVARTIRDLAACSVAMSRHDTSMFFDEKNKLEESLTQIPYKTLRFSQWYRLMCVLFLNGLLVAGKKCRENMQLIALDNNYELYDIEKLGFLFETGKYKDANEFFFSSNFFQKMKDDDPDSYNGLRYICQRMMGNSALPEYDETDSKFADYIRNKTVVIIAPGYREDYHTLKDDVPEGSLVALLNYEFDDSQRMVTNIIPHHPIIFENLEVTLQLNKIFGKSDFLKDFDFIITKADDVDISSLPFSEQIRHLFPKRSRVLSFLSLRGNVFNMAQHALIDLCHFECRVKLVNANLYLAKNQYMEGEGLKANFQERMLIFLTHDLIGNYNFTASLFHAGKFSADAMGKYVLNLGVDNYVAQMEDIFLNKYFQGGRIFGYQ